MLEWLPGHRPSLLGGLVIAAVVGLSASVATAAFVTVTVTAGSSVGADTLDPPTGVSASRVGADNNLSWTASVDTYADGYDIYRSTTSGSGFTFLASVAGHGTTTYSDTIGAATPTFESLSSDTGWTSSTTLAKPTGTAEGDLLVAVLGSEVCGGTKPTISGWTKRVDDTNSVALWVYERVATASEPSTYTFPFGRTCFYTADLLRYSGVDPATPTENWVILPGHPTPIGSPDTTSTVGNSVILRIAAFDEAISGAPAGHTIRANQQSVADTTTASADVVQATAGSAGSATWPSATLWGLPWLSVTTVIRPASQTYYYRVRATAGLWESADSNEGSA